MGTSIHALPQIPASVLPFLRVPETTAELPSAPVSVHPLPSTPETVLALPTAGVTLLPAGFVPYFPPELVVEATGEGTATAVVSGSLTAEATASSEGVSSTDLLPIQYLAADAAGAGDSSAEVTTAESITVDVSSEGTSSVDLAVRIDADASGSGSSSVDTAVRIDANTSGSGNSGAEVTLVGVLMPNVSGEGTASVELKTSAPTGMYKTGNTTMGTSAQVTTGWTADTANYPTSAVVSNGIAADGDQEGSTVSAQIVVRSTRFIPSNITLTLRLNGSTIIATDDYSHPSSATQTRTLTATGVNLNDGDYIALYAQGQTSTGLFIDASPDTWVRIIPS